MEKRGVGVKGEERESTFLLKRQATCYLLGPGLLSILLSIFFPLHTQVFVFSPGYFLRPNPQK